MTKVKICGITNLEDALLSAKFGADALGFNFYAKSPRYIAPEKAREIIEQLPAKVLKVGVFVNESLDKIVEIAAIAKLDALQLHGEETPEFARELKAKTNLEIIKAFRVSPEFKPEDILKYEVDAILLDAYNPQEHGGTGETFDWEIAKKVQEIFPKMYLAGGLSDLTVTDAISLVNPYAVDSCSLLEKEKGNKDKEKVNLFVKTIREWEKNAITDTYKLLEAIRLNPQRYIKKKSITLLATFFNGFETALNITNRRQLFDWKGLDAEYLGSFSDWVINKLGECDELSYSWNDQILAYWDNDELQAFDHFFELLEEFKLKKEDLGEK